MLFIIVNNTENISPKVFKNILFNVSLLNPSIFQPWFNDIRHTNITVCLLLKFAENASGSVRSLQEDFTVYPVRGD